jgi:hypothetical protein
VKHAAVSTRFMLGRFQIRKSVILSVVSRNYFTRSIEQPDDDYDYDGDDDDHDDDDDDNYITSY